MKNNKDKTFTHTCLAYLLAIMVFILWRIFAAEVLYRFISGNAEAYADIIFTLVTQIGIMFAIPFIWFTVVKKKTPVTFNQFVATQQKNDTLSKWGFTKPSGKVIAFAFGVGVLMFFFNIFVASLFNGILSILGHRGAATNPEEATLPGVLGFFVTLFCTAVLPGICEESAHRGLLLHGFQNKMSPVRAVLISALCFGFVHFNIVQFFYAFILGYLMGLAVLATRTIWTAIIMHFLNNGIGVYLTFAKKNNWIGGNFLEKLGEWLGSVSFLAYVALFVGLGYLIVMCIYYFARYNFIKWNIARGTTLPLHRGRGLAAIKYYLNGVDTAPKARLSVIEKTLFAGIIFFGTVVTTMTLYWGFM
jgi:membrane protease YdiL (CAAX protease family)